MGSPTCNLNLADVLPEVTEGIYACFAHFGSEKHMGALHYGPRPVHKDSPSCEVHLIDAVLGECPPSLTIELVAYLRPVQDFPSEQALIAQISADVDQARAILSAR
ncbi:MAG: riboflavin kinase [Candidatus Peregrinibacteria bacterium]|nr:riboflavin kinase [Candidatus Peregrinibacteria bacterium]